MEVDPLVNIYISMGNHNRQWENWLFLWPFSMAMSKYQRVTNQKQGFNWCLVFFKRFLAISWLSWNTTNNILWTIGRFETKTGPISSGCICNSMVDQCDVCNACHDFARKNWVCGSNNENCSVVPMKIYRRIQWYNIIMFHAIRMGAQTQQTHKKKLSEGGAVCFFACWEGWSQQTLWIFTSETTWTIWSTSLYRTNAAY